MTGPLNDGTKQGRFRWAVKTLQDRVAKEIDFGKTIPVTISDIADWEPPIVTKESGDLPRGASTEEFQVFQVTGSAIKTKLETDGDYHLLLEDEGGFELGVEIVQPLFAEHSIKLPEIDAVRQTFEQQFGKSDQVDKRYRRLNGIQVTVTGVGYWDDPHGQGGIGNGFELHPVLSIQVNG